MKTAAFLLSLGLVATGITFAVGRIEAQQGTLMDFCPARPNAIHCSAAALALVPSANLSDHALLTYINAIAAAAPAGRPSSRSCQDTAKAITVLAEALDESAVKDLALRLADRLCGQSIFGQDNAVERLPVSPEMHSYAGTTSSSSGQSSGSSGQSSGSTGQASSGASGSSSGAGEETSSSGSTGQASSGASGSSSGAGEETSSSGSTGQASSGASGSSSGAGEETYSSGSTGQASSGASGSSSGGAGGG